MSDTGRYLYAIARGIGGEDLAGIRGLRDVPLRLIEHHGLTAVVSEVDLEEFGEAGLRRNLEDLGWLEEVARTHNEVVHAVATKAPTAPLRLATIYRDDDGVRARLEQWHDALQQTLSRVEGCMEWSVKAFTAARTEPSPAPESTGGGAGTAYLMRRKAETAQREVAAEEAAALADEIHAVISQQVVASRRLPPQDRRLAHYEGTMTLNGAYLVDDTAVDDFRSAVQQLSAQHPDSRLDLQGPWPPYSFTTLDDT